ncbi:hypothetical protein HHL11_05050 [Ramlibacter sp. G-1-2-2]|uniref:Sel1 repeat family protein n=1 Tax=Ramlibacter agri TaxID=2728837 RepID=A0A848H5Y0_9BURK|nr:hypothetical protein [Ramlibacter agri]NML43108.1 hypothetical protein [Ramlibacter agri]
MQRIALVLAAAVLACSALLSGRAQPPATVDVEAAQHQAQDARFREAMRLCRAGHWSAAYGRFAALADEGHVPAARVALAMWQNGHRVYGTDWSAAPSQVLSWEQATGVPATHTVAASAE